MNTLAKFSRKLIQFVRCFFECRLRPARTSGSLEVRRGRVRVAALVTVFIIGLAAGPWTHPKVYGRTLIPSEEIAFPAAEAAAFVDVWSDDHRDLVLAGADGIAMFSPDGDTWRKTLHLPPLPAPVTVVAAGDVTGDGVNELVLGTAQAGALYVLRRSGPGWTLLAQTPYMWSPARAVVVADLTGDGKADIVALGDDGRLVAYRWDGVRLARVEPPPDMGKDRITHIDLLPPAEGEAGSRLVLAESGGRISVWSWPWVASDWETFVWGMPSSLVVFSGGNSPEGSIVVSTYERLLYHFRGQGDQFASAGAPLNDARLPFSFTVPVRLPGDGNVHVLADNGQGVGVWRIVGTNMTRVDEGWADDVRWALQLPEDDRFILGEAGRSPAIWNRMPGDFFQFTVNGNPVTLHDPPLMRQGQVMLSSRDWANALGLQLHWDPIEQRITFFRDFDYAMVTMGEWEAILPGGRRPVSLAPINDGGRTYVPPELPVWFGYSYRWDGRTRTLDVHSRGRGTTGL